MARKKNAVHKDLAGAQPFPEKATRVMHTPKAVPHIRKGGKMKRSSHVYNACLKTGVVNMPKGGGKRTRTKS